eukprot:6529631-Prymnesium_polylepis.1
MPPSTVREAFEGLVPGGEETILSLQLTAPPTAPPAPPPPPTIKGGRAAANGAGAANGGGVKRGGGSVIMTPKCAAARLDPDPVALLQATALHHACVTHGRATPPTTSVLHTAEPHLLAHSCSFETQEICPAPHPTTAACPDLISLRHVPVPRSLALCVEYTGQPLGQPAAETGGPPQSTAAEEQ